MAIAVLYEKEELKAIIKECLSEHQKEKAHELDELTTYSINQVAKMLSRSHPTIKNLVISGKISATNDGRITQAELNRYLSGKHTDGK